jgi:phospholipid/cholesterol/gamma-HCH transport system permease protein
VLPAGTARAPVEVSSRFGTKSAFDPARRKTYCPAVKTVGVISNSPASDAGPVLPSGCLRQFDVIGRNLIHLVQTVKGLVAFALITLGVAFTKFNASSSVIHPLVRAQIHRAGLRLLPMTSFLAGALGLVIIGQMVALLTRVGAQNFAGTVMVTVVVRELGPLVAALLVLVRAGAAYVIELGTARALGEVEALEALCIDPIHYLVLPRVIGLALAIFSLTVYFILVALLSGYLFAFVQDVPLLPAEYFNQLAMALTWEDFALLAFKTCAFGIVIAIVTCYQGLSQPLQIEEVSGATTRAVVQSVVACVLLDLLFIVVYLVM